MSLGATIDLNPSPGVVLVSADEVRRRFGSHWSAPISTPNKIEHVIREIPGGLDNRWHDKEAVPDWVFPGTPDGLRDAKEWAYRRRMSLRSELDKLQARAAELSSDHWIISIAAAVGFGEIRKNAHQLRASRLRALDLTKLQHDLLAQKLDGDSPDAAVIEPFADHLRMRPILEIGAPLWKLITPEARGNWFLIEELTVADAAVYDNRGVTSSMRARDELDILVHYRTSNDQGFDLDMVQSNDPVEVPFLIYAHRLFLKKDAAEAVAREHAKAIHAKIQAWLETENS